ncbi:efflux RND transporter periplasmic adaptor subunit [Neptuniibacter caesariensis]|nr:efflux RND transporter periplasmic adaptor subunit [Neptuniibacter caesariensis]
MKRSLGLITLFAAANLSAEEALPTVDCVISPSKVVDVGTAVSGVIERINAELGQPVSSNQLLVELEAGVEKATVKLAAARASMKADLSAEQVNLRYDRLQEKRVDQLAAKQLASSQNKDEASRIKRLSYWRTEQVREELHLRELELERAKAQLEEKRIYSVIDGVVAEQFKQEGEYVEDQPILRLVQLNPLHVNAVFPMEHYPRIQVGMQAEVFPETDQKQGYPVVVERIDPLGDAASGTFGVRLSLDNTEAALPAGLKCFLQVDEHAVADAQPNQKEPSPVAETMTAPEQANSNQLAKSSTLEAKEPENHSLAEAAVIEVPNTDLKNSRVEDSLQGGTMNVADQPADMPVTTEATQDTAVASVSSETPQEKQKVDSAIKTADNKSVTEQPKEPVSQQHEAVVVLNDQVFGPFSDKDQLSGLTRQLEGAQVDYSVKEERSLVTKGYIVLSSPDYQLRPSQLYRAFQEKGVTDMMRLPRKSYQGRISFGTYKGPVQASKRKNELALLGINTQLVERKREVSAYWVNVPRLPADLAIKQ